MQKNKNQISLSREILALIPARGGSTGLPGKNIRVLGGLPLIAHTIKEAQKSKHITRIIVATDSEEIAEIEQDYKWGKSEKGRYVSTVNDWHQEFHADFRRNSAFDEVYLGAHSEHMVVFMTGKVESQKVYDELLSYIHEKNPPYKILSKVAILTEDEQ